jgi:hypothetical protein
VLMIGELVVQTVEGSDEFDFSSCRHEGRTWYTSHRGRLWIAAAVRVPTPHEIRNAEHMYEILKEGELISLCSETM